MVGIDVVGQFGWLVGRVLCCCLRRCLENARCEGGARKEGGAREEGGARKETLVETDNNIDCCQHFPAMCHTSVISNNNQNNQIISVKVL